MMFTATRPEWGGGGGLWMADRRRREAPSTTTHGKFVSRSRLPAAEICVTSGLIIFRQIPTHNSTPLFVLGGLGVYPQKKNFLRGTQTGTPFTHFAALDKLRTFCRSSSGKRFAFINTARAFSASSMPHLAHASPSGVSAALN